MSNRKLIRPSLAEIKEQLTVRQPRAKRPAPNDQTNAENFYYVKQIQNKTPMQITSDGHSPDEYRASTVRNLDAWYAAFSVQPNQKLFLSEKDRVRVW